MSTGTQVIQVPARPPVIKSAKAEKLKTVPVKKRPIHCHRKPSMHTEAALRACTWRLIEDGYSYTESLELLRVYLMTAALNCSKHVKTTAAARLKISREHLDNYLARGKELL